MTLIRSTGVDQEPHFSQEPLPYSSQIGNWSNMNDYPQSTMAGYGSNEFVYMQPGSGLPSDPMNRMPPPLQPHSSPQQVQTPQVHQSPLPHQQHQPTHQDPNQGQGQTTQDHSQSHHLQQQAHQHHQSPAMIQTAPQQQPLPQLPMMPTWPSMLITSGNSYSAPTLPTLAAPATITPTTMASTAIAPATIAPATLAPAPAPAPVPTTPSPAPAVNIAPRGPQPPPIRTSRLDREGRPAPRKMLTDEDRRNMCLYAIKNPNAKQNEIGAEFGVERSTVSKVLRHKDRYLNYNSEERNTSPGRRNRNKSPDIERALENWARKQRKHLMPVTEDDIQERIRCFTSTAGDSASGRSPINEAWLKSFREKYCTGPGRLSRRASETNIPKRHIGSPSLGSLKQPNSNGRSSTSPTIGAAESPYLGQQADDGTGLATSAPSGSSRGLMSFADHAGGGMGPHSGHADHTGHGGNGMTGGLSIRVNMTNADSSNSQSTTTLSSAFTETPVSSFPGSALSSTMPFTFSPDSNAGSFLPHDSMDSSGASSFQRPRSQTLPALNLEYMGHPQNPQAPQDNTTLPPVESMAPRYHYQQMGSAAPSSAVDSPMTDISAPSYGLDSAVVSPQLRRSSSNNSLFMGIPRSAGGLGGATIGASLSAIGGSAGSSPNSLTQEDAQRGAETLLAYMQACPNSFDQTELMTLARLSEKLRIHQPQQPQLEARVTMSPQGMGGLSRIPEGDVEMANDMQHNKMEPPMAS